MLKLTYCGFCICVISAIFAPAAFTQAVVDPGSVWQRATLYRDEWGVPHIYADDFQAMAFAFGWAQAEDHLEQMLIAYRVANGRASEVFGPSMAESDEFALKLGHGMLARSALPNLDPLTQDLCIGFASGVNAWIVQHPEKTPEWADGVSPEDILALLHCYLMSFAPFDIPGAYRRGPAATSGNAWAVGPDRSVTGVSMLAINPHEFYDGPFRWYEAHLVCRGMDVSGATLFGIPVIMQGHNGLLGWALTPNQPDFADIFIEPPFGVEAKRDPKSVMPRATETISNERLLHMMMLANTRTYYVATPGGPVERHVVCMDTARGPIMSVEGGRILSYKIGGYRDFGALAQFAAMGVARDLGSFQAAVSMHQLPCFHIIYADRGGNIFYLYNAKMGDKPVAAAPTQIDEGTMLPTFIDWSAPVLASRFGWNNIIPIDALPAVVNPSSGYVQASGNPPWGATENSGIDPQVFPVWFGTDQDSMRAHRVRQLLGTGQRTRADFQAMLFDDTAPLAEKAVPMILEAADALKDSVASAHPDTAIGLATLRNWDYRAAPSSVGMTYFHAWWTSLQSQNVSGLASGHGFFHALEAGSAVARQAALNAAADAARLMRNEFNSITVPWGDAHTIRRGSIEMPIGGGMSGEPIFVASDFVYDSKKWRATYGFGYGMVVSFGEQPNASSVSAFGSSENPASAHYADQLPLMTSGRLKQAWFSVDDVQRNAASARGRIVHLRPDGMEALFAMQAAEPVNARLNVSLQEPADLPEGLVAFTLFVRPEVSPLRVAVETHIQVRIPEVLCATQDLERLAVYAHDGSEWSVIEQQELDVGARSFSAYDNHSGRVYCVLGPALLRAQRLHIPGEADAPIEVRRDSEPSDASEHDEAYEGSGERKWWWGLLPQRPLSQRPQSQRPQPSQRSPALPAVPEMPRAMMPGETNHDVAPPIIPTEAIDAAKEQSDAGTRVRRNFNVHLPGARERARP